MEEEKEKGGNFLKNIKKGIRVEILTKAGKKIIGIVEDTGSRTDFHENGIMVMLKSGEVGRVKKILNEKANSEIEHLIKKGESFKTEFKSDALWSLNKTSQEVNESKSYDLHTFKQKASKVILAKSISSFLNSEGGTLIIGVKEKKNSNNDYEILGIEEDLKKLKAIGKAEDTDSYKRMIIDDIIRPYFPSKIYNHMNDYLQINFEELEDKENKNTTNKENKTLCIIKIKRADIRVFLDLEGTKMFFIRNETETRRIENEDLVDYCMKRFVR